MCLLVCGCTTQTRCPALGTAWRPGVQGCHKPLAKESQRALTPVRMADVHTTRQGGTWGHGTGQDWLVEAVPPGHGRKQTEAFLTWAARCSHRGSTAHKLRATLEADKIDYELRWWPDKPMCLRVCVVLYFYLCGNLQSEVWLEGNNKMVLVKLLQQAVLVIRSSKEWNFNGMCAFVWERQRKWVCVRVSLVLSSLTAQANCFLPNRSVSTDNECTHHDTVNLSSRTVPSSGQSFYPGKSPSEVSAPLAPRAPRMSGSVHSFTGSSEVENMLIRVRDWALQGVVDCQLLQRQTDSP